MTNAYKEEADMIYQPKGVCSNAIDIEVEEGIIKSVQFTGGCNGNTQGISPLVVLRAHPALISWLVL